MSRRWTDKEDRFLLSYGPGVGFDFVARHDLGRTGCAGVKRAAWLKKNKPELVRWANEEHRKFEEKWGFSCDVEGYTEPG